MTNVAATPIKMENVLQVIDGRKYICSGWALKTDGGIFSTDGEAPRLFKSKKIALRASSEGLIADGLKLV